ncbi:MAG: hypothetical protein K6G26_13445 [Lachnospiraceae bacterium]|nr:hypothetical protein [Lachnospiraceae bacterium]
MSPFQEYLNKAKEVREDYAIQIANNPEQKDALEKELKELLAKLLDECEKKELEAIKRV